MAILDRVTVSDSADYVRLGSIVRTGTSNYYISVSLGMVQVDGDSFLCVALNSPIGAVLAGKRKGDQLVFHQQEMTILEVV